MLARLPARPAGLPAFQPSVFRHRPIFSSVRSIAQLARPSALSPASCPARSAAVVRTAPARSMVNTTATTPPAASVASVASATPTTSATQSLSAAAASNAELTWNQFLSLRKIRRRYNLASSAVFAFVCSGTGLVFALQNDLETTVANRFGLDPIFVVGILSVTFGTAGWLTGPFLGNAVFGLVYRRFMPKIAQKEQAFYARIKKHRVDPSNSTPQNPVPDYYGEKIGSVSDYRRWLKDQRAYKLKRGRSIV